MKHNFLLLAALTILCNIRIYDFTHIPESKGLQYKYLDEIIYDLQEQSQNQSDTQCLKTFTRLLYGVKNHTLWATWMWDSMNVSPVGYLTGTQHQLGNYKQCLNPPWLNTHPEFRTKYCLVRVQPKGPYLATKETDDSVNPYAATSTFTRMPRKLFKDLSLISWGLCLPESCHSSEFVKMFASILLKHNYLYDDFSKSTITVKKCHISDGRKNFSLDSYIFVVLFVVLTTLAISSTWIISYKKDVNVNVTVKEIAHAFSVKENLNKLTRTYPEELDVLNGIRFIAASLIVTQHAVFIYVMSPLNSALNLKQLMESEGLFYLVILPFMVDIFFVMSGLLSAKHLLASLDTTEWSKTTAVKHIIKRYFRLAPVLAAAMLVVIVVLQDFSSGPIWELSAKYMLDNCMRNWWLSLIMLNNYIRSDAMCNPIAWSAQCDFHMTIVAIGLVYLYSKQRRSGIIAFALVFALSLILPAVTTYIYNLPPVLKPVFMKFEDLHKETYTEAIYIKSHNRIGPYLIGMILGYIMSIYDPNIYKNTISKKFSVLGVILSCGVMFAISLMTNEYSTEYFSRFGELVLAGTVRTLFGVGIGLLIICLVYGTVPFLNDFLSWKVFRPLSRLSYGIYLLHFVYMLKRYSSSRVLQDVDEDSVLVESLGNIALAVIFSFISWFLVEAPFNHLCNYCLKSKAVKFELLADAVASI